MRRPSLNRAGWVLRIGAAATGMIAFIGLGSGCGGDDGIDTPARYQCFQPADPYAGGGVWHRANFHMHSRHSDGALSGAALVELYQQHGYTVLCLLDHNEYGDQDGGVVPGLQTDSVPHDWNNDGVTQAVHVFGSGTEAYVRDWTEPPPSWSVERWSRNMRLDWSESPILLPGAEFTNGGFHVGLIGYPSGAIEPPLKTPIAFPPAALRTRQAGGFVFLAHPGAWNNSPATLIKLLDLHSFEAIEIANGLLLTRTFPAGAGAAAVPPAAPDAAHAAPLPWDATPAWDALLSRGYRLWGMANDDEHTRVGAPDAYPFAAFDMVLARDPTETGFMRALHAGSFYGSTGLFFVDLGVKDGAIDVWAPEANQIRFIGWAGRILATQSGGRATYRPRGDEGYVRVEATGDPKTTAWAPQAWSQPFWIEAAPCGGTSTPQHPSGD
jgi:hypothetical protein